MSGSGLMQYDIDLNELAIRLGIDATKVRKSLATYEAMGEIFPMLEKEGCRVGLFGGTALNKIYFGKKQRLSYDLDIFVYSYQKTLRVLKKIGAKMTFSGAFPGRKVTSARMTYKDIVLDLVPIKKIFEEPEKLQLVDLLYYYGQLVPPIIVPSYSIEYLMAEKTFAMLDRNELKDIYDTWIGFRLLTNKRKYISYMNGIAKIRGIRDIIAYSDRQMAGMLANVEYYDKKYVDVTNQPNARMMMKDIKAFIEML